MSTLSSDLESFSLPLTKRGENTHGNAMAEGRIWQPGKIIITVGTLIWHHMTPWSPEFGIVHWKSRAAQTQVNNFHTQRLVLRREGACESAAESFRHMRPTVIF